MKVPALPTRYALTAVLSPGPVAIVALASGPDGPCVVKTAAIARALPAIARETAVLGALAGTEGVPRVLDAWEGGLALERLAMPTLRESAALLQADRTARNAVARAAFARLGAVHQAVDARGVPLDVVHGDVSPDNLFVRASPEAEEAHVTLADFGLARWREDARVAHTEAPGAFRGTLLYAAPEVARGEAFDARADDFALAASLLHVATGLPLRRDDLAPPVLLVDAGTHPLDASHPWHSLARTLFDPAVSSALLACLAFDPRDRPRLTPAPC